jgi:hypothetical protein
LWRVPADLVQGCKDYASVAVADLVGGETPDHFIDGLLEV